jgi:osmotically-inducible protein OsmY
MDRVSTALEDDETILIDDLSVELRGAVVVLRGIAGSPEDRTRAGDLASAVPGVERVDNQLGADPAEED